MKIEDLDEFQGLTAEMVGDWLKKNGWAQQTHMAFQLGAPPVVIGYSFKKGGAQACTGMRLDVVLHVIAETEKRSPQSLLREINPRWRKGWPSEAARKAHDKWWLARTLGGWVHLGVFDCDGGFSSCGIDSRQSADQEACAEWWFWTADGNAERVRWPTDGDGRML